VSGEEYGKRGRRGVDGEVKKDVTWEISCRGPVAAI
jgi:hypothetical protein